MAYGLSYPTMRRMSHRAAPRAAVRRRSRRLGSGGRGRLDGETKASMHANVSPESPLSETKASMHAIVSLAFLRRNKGVHARECFA